MGDTLNTLALESSISAVKSSLSSLHSEVDAVDTKVSRLEEKTNKLQETLEELKSQFQMLAEDQKKSASLQRAISELVRVRQEIESKYGNHSVVRETMLGVLQATDVALVKKTTISRVSEELMISAPNYWLAPCLVAVAAWISNDRDLAQRAIAEAMRRDEEKTALCMALICRRNGRIQTGFEWLSLYFSKQSASDFTEETFTFIDAYVNGVFGTDEKHMCQGYVAKWIDEIRGNNSNFESSQEHKWEDYCQGFSHETKLQFPALSDSVKEFPRIDAYIRRVNAVEKIRETFNGIKEAHVDQDALKKAIDAELIQLIGRYDSEESEIRKEEEYLKLVKFYEGDEEKAKAEIMAKEARLQQRKMDFVEQMTSEITSGENTAPSKRKTAVTFLGDYINKGFSRYISEKRDDFPSDVTIQVDSWSGKSNDGSEYQELASSYEKQMNELRDSAIARVNHTTPKVLLLFAVLFAIAAAGLFFVVGPAALLALIGTFICLLSRRNAQKNIDNAVSQINEDYATRTAAGKEKLESVLNQWKAAKNIVNDFDQQKNLRIVA